MTRGSIQEYIGPISVELNGVRETAHLKTSQHNGSVGYYSIRFILIRGKDLSNRTGRYWPGEILR